MYRPRSKGNKPMNTLGSLVLLAATAAFAFGTRFGLAAAILLGSLGLYLVK